MEKVFRTVDEVLADESFLAWYFKKSPGAVQEWNRWLAANPGHHQKVAEATALLAKMTVKEKEIPPGQIESAIERLNSSLVSTTSQEAKLVRFSSRHKWWMAAAAILLLFSIGVAFWKFKDDHKTTLAANFGEVNSHQLPDGSQ